MLVQYKAHYDKIDTGFKGKILEWPVVKAEGKTFEECRSNLRIALSKTVERYKKENHEIPLTSALVEETITIDID